jgi:riboflavin kinase/FMN adenylyltransferase
MKVIYGLGAFKKKLKDYAAVVTVGVFDGVHRGHQKILRSIVKTAQTRGLVSVVVTFAYHPSHLLDSSNKIPHLLTLEQKLSLLEKEGIDYCCVIYFDKSFACLSPEHFIENILIKQIKMKALYVGEDFLFGRRAKGNISLLKKLSQKFHFKLVVFRHLKINGRVVSSTLIRRLVQKGQLASAQIFLGRPFVLSGIVVAGEGRGRHLGFPTANLRLKERPLLSEGVYATRVLWKSRSYKSVTYIGTKPTFPRNKKKLVVEVYLFDFLKNIYDHLIEVYFIKKIRNDRTFRSAEVLKDQIERDVKNARFLL